MQSKATTVREYLAELPEDRRKALEAVRKVLRAHLDPRIQEHIQYGMIGYSVPHSVYPDGYHCDPEQPLPFLSLASQKNHMALYLFCIYGSEEESQRFDDAWRATGKKLDRGKSCVRFKKLEDVALDVVGETVRRMDVDTFVRIYEEALAGTSARKGKAGKKASKKKAASTKRPASRKKPATKKKASRGA